MPFTFLHKETLKVKKIKIRLHCTSTKSIWDLNKKFGEKCHIKKPMFRILKKKKGVIIKY